MHIFASCMSVEFTNTIFLSPHMHTHMYLITMLVKEKIGRICRYLKDAYEMQYRSANNYDLFSTYIEIVPRREAYSTKPATNL